MRLSSSVSMRSAVKNNRMNKQRSFLHDDSLILISTKIFSIWNHGAMYYMCVNNNYMKAALSLSRLVVRDLRPTLSNVPPYQMWTDSYRKAKVTLYLWSLKKCSPSWIVDGNSHPVVSGKQGTNNAPTMAATPTITTSVAGQYLF